MKVRGLGWLLPLAGLAIAASAGGAVLSPEDRASLQEAWTVRLADGQEIRGRLAGAEAGSLRLRRVLEGGEITVAVDRADIESLTLPGREVLERAGDAVRGEDWPAARELLGALYRQRRVALDLLPRPQLDLLSFLPRAHLAAGEEAAAVGVAEELLAVPAAPATLARLREIRLLGHYRLELYEEAGALARAGREEGPRYRASALPDLVLGLLALRAGEVRTALRHCLRPIVFSGPTPPRYLPACYALAVLAAHELGATRLRETLDEERRQRGLPWQPPPALAARGELAGNGALPASDGQPLLLRPSPGEVSLPYVPVPDAAELSSSAATPWAPAATPPEPPPP